MRKSLPIDDDTMGRFRAYLKLLARTQLDSWLGERVDASDIVQQTMLDAVARRAQFRGDSEAEFLAWVRKILANNLIDQFRYQGRAKRDMARNCSLDEEISQSFHRIDALVTDADATPSQRASTNEQLLRLPDALEQLSEAQREAILLHHLQGLTLAQTAERLGRSEAAVGGLLHRGLKRLHKLLEGP